MNPTDVPDGDVTKEFITPELAAEWLGGPSVPNRKRNEARVERYALSILGNVWGLSWDCIAFNKANERMNGEHRLAAIVESGVGVWTLVVRNLDDVAYVYGDQGGKRQFRQLLEMRGISYAGPLQAATRLLWQYRHGHMLADKTSKAIPEITDLDWLFTHECPDLVEYAKPGIALNDDASFGSEGLAIVLLYIFNEHDPVNAEAFFDQLASGEELHKGDAILVLRNKLYKMHENTRASKGSDSTFKAAITFKAFNAWRRHETLTGIGWRPGELFPVLDALLVADEPARVR